MPSVLTLFWLLLLLSCTFAGMAGGKSGRIGASLLVLATIATWNFEISSSWAQTHLPVMIIDTVLLIALYTLAIRSRCYWPIWATGFHLLTVAGHIASIIMPSFRFGMYWQFSGIWSVLVMMSMIVGISIDRTHVSHIRTQRLI